MVCDTIGVGDSRRVLIESQHKAKIAEKEMPRERILNLKPFRERKGITQAELAKVLGLTPKAVNFYELGQREPTLANLVRMADYFGVSVDSLLGRDSP